MRNQNLINGEIELIFLDERNKRKRGRSVVTELRIQQQAPWMYACARRDRSRENADGFENESESGYQRGKISIEIVNPRIESP